MHGLKEKISYLEGQLAAANKRELIKQQKDQEQENRRAHKEA